MIHELRIYHCLPGKIGALNERFANTTLKLWEKHGIVPVGFWTVLIGPSNNALYYLLQWESLADRERKWTAFATDPAWLAARAKSEESGPILERTENCMLTPTAYSKLR